MPDFLIVTFSFIGFIVLLIAISSPFIFLGIYLSKKFGGPSIAGVKLLYEKSLYDLEKDPGNGDKYQIAIERGRQYYGLLHPNTIDINSKGISNFKDNAGIGELKLRTDITGRLAKSQINSR